jgi:ParB-like chromosome segregation protein Spo0J
MLTKKKNPGVDKGSRQIAVTCQTAESLPLEKIVAFQGNLKTLEKQEFEKLKASILKYGLSFPSFIWKRNGSLNCLDGHQRTRVLAEMKKEGWSIPPVPVVYVDAKNEKEAKEKVLLLSSHYGKISMESLYEFMGTSGIDFVELDQFMELPEFSLKEFQDYYFNDNFVPQAVKGQQKLSLPVTELRPHPKNYRGHPDDQIEHLIKSIKAHGFTRNIIVAKDNTILAGHGVVQAATKMGMRHVPVVRLDLDSENPEALKILVGDNEMEHLGEVDDRVLSEVLKLINDSVGLDGTGYDERMLANLVFVSRSQAEIGSMDEAAAWVGMPAFELNPAASKIVVSFENEKDRLDFAKRLKLTLTEKVKEIWWPPKDRQDVVSVRYE